MADMAFVAVKGAQDDPQNAAHFFLLADIYLLHLSGGNPNPGTAPNPWANTVIEVSAGASPHDIEKAIIDWMLQIAPTAFNPPGPYVLTPHDVYFTPVDRG